ncbi:protein containing Fibrinogen, alpha/beta/gamma chain, partial [Candidatus Magnetomorum sp. HK-1]
VRTFKLVFFNSSDTIIFETNVYKICSQNEPQGAIFDNIIQSVKSVNLVIESSKMQIEIREVEFRGFESGKMPLNGDYNTNAKLDLGDAIGILKEITSDSNYAKLTSCKTILEKGFSTGDGYYTIYPNLEGPIIVFCDMTTSNGGWMKITNSTIVSWTKFEKQYGNMTSSINTDYFIISNEDKENACTRA